MSELSLSAGLPELPADLQSYVRTLEDGTRIFHHPLYISPFFYAGDPQENLRILQIIEGKKAKVALLEKQSRYGVVLMYEKPYQPTEFIRRFKPSEHAQNPAFVETLACIWMEAENPFEQFSQWEHLFSHVMQAGTSVHLMEEGEREHLESLPDELTLYRGQIRVLEEGHTLNLPVEADDLNEGLLQGFIEPSALGFSWTLKKEEAIWFAKRRLDEQKAQLGSDKVEPILITAKVRKSNVLAYLSSRNEEEIVAHPLEVQISEIKKAV